MNPSSVQPEAAESVRASALAERTDAELIEESKRGNLAAFEQLFNRYQKRVYNLIYRMVGNEQDAADLTQDVFVRVYNSLHTLKAGEALVGWLRMVATNITRDHFRKTQRTIRADSLDARVEFDDGDVEREIEDWTDNPERALDRKDVQEAVQRAVKSLSDEHRMVVAMHHIEGMDVKDIANLLKVPAGTVKSRLARAREELKRKLGHYVEA